MSMTTEDARRILAHPFLNFRAVAAAYYAGASSRPEQALRRRVWGVPECSPDTLSRLEEVLKHFLGDLKEVLKE